MKTNKKIYFNPGCALSIYKPEIEHRILAFLNKNYGEVEMHNICCHHDPLVASGSLIINVCAGCDRRFSTLYDGITTISLWEVLDSLETFEFSDYNGLKMSIHDACPIRDKPQIHKAIRSLLAKMNIEVIEAPRHSQSSQCCGDDFYKKIPLEKVLEKMKERASSMPCDDVCVYCVSCIKSMYIGGKNPRYMIDLLFGETTDPKTYETVAWHKQLQVYIDKH